MERRGKKMTKAKKKAKVLEFPTTTIEDNYPLTSESDVCPVFEFFPSVGLLRKIKVPEPAIEMLNIYSAVTNEGGGEVLNRMIDDFLSGNALWLIEAFVER